MDREITQPIAIADAAGRLRRDAVGWARQPIFQCGFSPGVSRVERWSYWGVLNRECALTVLVADLGGLFGFALVSFVELRGESRPIDRLYLRPRGLPGFSGWLGDTTREDFVLDVPRLQLALLHQGETMRIESRARTLFGKTLAIDLVVDRPRAHETVNVLVPWDDERFHFTSKQQALATRGTVTLHNGRVFSFGPENQSFACLDFGRGRWPRSIDWNWGFASARLPSGQTLGFNLGGKWTDGTGVTENGVVLDGKLHKLSEPVDFRYDTRDFKKTWRIQSRDTDRVTLALTPIRHRAVRLPLGVIGAELHQMLGRYDGTVIDGDGKRIVVDDVVGLAESFRAYW